ncbi:MAG: hypothetical protein IPM68_15255 [Flavobacteriales bacterium]|nr:hypothetical protein [Flavobacteriales bacterium]
MDRSQMREMRSEAALLPNNERLEFHEQLNAVGIQGVGQRLELNVMVRTRGMVVAMFALIGVRMIVAGMQQCGHENERNGLSHEEGTG